MTLTPSKERRMTNLRRVIRIGVETIHTSYKQSHLEYRSGVVYMKNQGSPPEVTADGP